MLLWSTPITGPTKRRYLGIPREFVSVGGVVPVDPNSQIEVAVKSDQGSRQKMLEMERFKVWQSLWGE